MVNLLICDDHLHARKMLEKVAFQNPLVSYIYTAEDGVEAFKISQQNQIDIALMDIDMPNLNGIDSAKLISKAKPNTRFIFVTAYMEYALDSFSVHPYNYLIKPIDIGELKETLNELIVKTLVQSNGKNIEFISCKSNAGSLMITTKDIIYFERVGKDTKVNTITDEYYIGKSLTDLESVLNSKFVRVHQSYIVNTALISRIEEVGSRTYCIKFNNTRKIAYLSRYKFEKFKSTFIY